jgi:hypothetical protein
MDTLYQACKVIHTCVKRLLTPHWCWQNQCVRVVHDAMHLGLLFAELQQQYQQSDSRVEFRYVFGLGILFHCRAEWQHTHYMLQWCMEVDRGFLYRTCHRNMNNSVVYC